MQNIKDSIFLKLLGKRIRSIRRSQKLTQADLAFRFGNYAEHLGRIERGEYNVTICTLKAIAEALDISKIKLFEDQDALFLLTIIFAPLI